MQETMQVRTRRQGRPCTAWMYNINMWTGLPVPVEESIRMTEDRDKWRKSTVWPILGSRTAKEHNRTTAYIVVYFIHHYLLSGAAEPRLNVDVSSCEHSYFFVLSVDYVNSRLTFL